MPERDPLQEYREKRKQATPEPAGAAPAGAGSSGGAFVVHQHAARRLHYDLRLEVDGVLWSWAVPKGPSLDPEDKRLAVHTENHPIEYLDFEEVIPAGAYGAGAMILWDRGTWRPLDDPIAGLEAGKLLFELRGYKLRGIWTLVKIAKGDNEWLMIREKRFSDRSPDAPRTVDDLPAESVHSGLTVEQLAEGYDPSPVVATMLEEREARARAVRAADVKMMLAKPRAEPFTDPAWIFELKLDGFRMLGAKSGAGPELVTRNGNDATPAFPELATALTALPYEDVVLDGEVVVHDEAGLPSFQRIQRRALLRRQPDIERASRHRPATFYAFDVLGLLGHDLRPLPLTERKAILEAILPPVGPIRYVDHFPERGEDLFENVLSMGLEGIVGKRASSRYRGGRSGDWVKIRAHRTDDLVVVGFTLPKGSRTGFGALHLAGYRDGDLVYAGRVGTGFSQADLESIREDLEAIEVERPPCDGPTPTGAEHRWVEPERVCEVRYLETTEDGFLRHPSFQRMRADKPASECVLPAPRGAEPQQPGEAALKLVAASATPTVAEVRIANAEKVFWPEEGYTKGDLCAYYRAIAPALLPYLRDRPLVLTRFPDGIEGTSFYQKNTPGFVPDWIRTVGIWSDHSDRELAYVVCDDVATLLYLANMGTIPLHVWASRVETLDHPDWCILDLDPKGAPFENVVEVARTIRRLCKEIRLPAYVKTSGSSGLHILIPLDGHFDYEMSRTLGELLGRAVVARIPGIATLERKISDRQGKVYLDYLQNRRGQLLVAPFSVRPLPGAPVSTPLRWREVGPRLEIGNHTMTSVPRRVSRQRGDPLLELLDADVDLLGALERLHAILADRESTARKRE